MENNPTLTTVCPVGVNVQVGTVLKYLPIPVERRGFNSILLGVMYMHLLQVPGHKKRSEWFWVFIRVVKYSCAIGREH